METSQPRSRILADAFKRAGLVERTGRGITRMFEATLRVGRDAPYFRGSTDASVTAEFALTSRDPALNMVDRRRRTKLRPARVHCRQPTVMRRSGG